MKVGGFGINHSEIFTRKGLSPSVVFPRVLGIECVGTIAASSAPDTLAVGQKCISIMGEMGRQFDGGYAEYVLLPNEQIYVIQTDLEWAELAAVPETYYTAYRSMLNLKIQEEDSVLIRGATSGVGVAFLRLIRARFPQMHITGTTRNRMKFKLLQETGFSAVLEDCGGKLEKKASIPDKYTKVLELIGPATLKDSFEHTQEGGVVCSAGQLGGKWTVELDPIMELPINGYLTSCYSGNVNAKILNEMLTYISDYNVYIKPEKVFDLEHTADAHRYLESRESFGKTVVVTP